jgi:hypothetical protein
MCLFIYLVYVHEYGNGSTDVGYKGETGSGGEDGPTLPSGQINVLLYKLANGEVSLETADRFSVQKFDLFNMKIIFYYSSIRFSKVVGSSLYF